MIFGAELIGDPARAIYLKQFGGLQRRPVVPEGAHCLNSSL